MPGSSRLLCAARAGTLPISEPSPRLPPLRLARIGRPVMAGACLLLALAAAGSSESYSLESALAAVYKEVKELGPRPGREVISWNFSIGRKSEADDDDTFKDSHVAVVIQGAAGQEKMTILVTRMEAVPGNPGVRQAGESRVMSCVVRGGVASVLRSDFEEKEAPAVAVEILKSVRNKKRLLRS